MSAAGKAEDLEAQAPLFRVVRGAPTEEEIAALTVALMSLRPQPNPSSNPIAEVGRMLARRQRIGAGLRPGPGSWRRAQPQRG